MKLKALFAMPLMFLCFMLLPGNALAMPDSDIEINLTSPVNSLVSESGVVAVEQFPAQVKIDTTAKVGAITSIQSTFNGKTQAIAQTDTLNIENKEACGAYTITAKTDNGAVLTMTANVVLQVKATYDIRYRTIAMNLKKVFDGDQQIKIFSTPQRINLVNANTIAEYEKERIAGIIGRSDGKTYTLIGSLVVEIHDFATGKIIGTYDVNENFDSLSRLLLVEFRRMEECGI